LQNHLERVHCANKSQKKCGAGIKAQQGRGRVPANLRRQDREDTCGTSTKVEMETNGEKRGVGKTYLKRRRGHAHVSKYTARGNP